MTGARPETVAEAIRLEERMRGRLRDAELRVASGGAIRSGPVLELARRRWIAALRLVAILRRGEAA